VPTEEEIRQKCLEFQAGWSDEERARRLVGHDPEKAAVDIRVISESVLRSNYTATVRDEPVFLEDFDTSGE
jgi:hypothetical protein